MHSLSQTTKRAAIALVFLLAPSLVFAASLSISPQSDTYAVGKIFSVRVRVSSSVAINAVAGNLTFPADKLQVTSVSKTGSILSLWVSDPSFNNKTGRVSFEGVVPNPGFQGSGGVIVVVTFKVVSTGSATVNFLNATTLANDGNGTEVLDSTAPGTFTLTEAPPEPEPEVVVPVEVAPAPAPVPPPVIVAPTSQRGFFELSLIILIVLLVIIVLWIIYFLLLKRRKNKKGSPEDLDHLTVHAFGLLKADVVDSIALLEKTQSRRRLTDEEDAILERLRKNLHDAERLYRIR